MAAVDRAHLALRELGVDATTPQRYPQYNPDYYATFFNDPDGLRLELVARTPHRENVARRFDEFRHFLNPLAALEGERVGVFHIASEQDWQAAQRTGLYRHESLEREGFIHCSTRPQVLPTAARYFAGQQGLLLLQLDAARLADSFRYEAPADPARPYELFPHLYAALPIDAVLRVQPLHQGPDGSFAWPSGES